MAEEEAPVAAATEEETKTDQPQDGEAAAKAAPKRRGRPRDEDAPKRPQAPKSEFGAELRVKLKEQRPELAKDLKAMFAAVNEEWEKVPQEEKDAKEAVYLEKKKIFDKEFAIYKKTTGFREFSKKLKGFLDIKAKKKMIKKHKKEAPLKPKNGYQTFTGEIRAKEEMIEKFKDMERADVAAYLSKAWEDAGEEVQEKYNSAATAARKKWEEEMVVFRRTDTYREQVKEFVALETKQNIRKVKEEAEDHMPRRPSSAVVLWADKTDNRAGLKEMTEKFRALSEEERKPYLVEAEQLKAEFKKGMAEFNASKHHLAMRRKTLMQEKRQVVMTARKQLLVDMPKRPGRANAVFASEFKGNKLEIKEAWEKLSDEEKQTWEEKRNVLMAEWEKGKAAFLEREEWKKFQEACAESRAMKLVTKGKAKAKSKQELLMAKLEASMPAKPMKPIGAFLEANKDTLKEGEKLKDLKRKWEELSAEERKSFEEKQEEASKKFVIDVEEWSKTPEGQQWARLDESKKRKQFETRARSKCLLADAVPDEIKVQASIKPNATPQGYFMEEKKQELLKENPAFAPRDLNKKVLAMWEELDEAGKEAYKTKTDTSALKKSEAYHKYVDMHQGLQMRHKLRGLKQAILNKLPKKPPTAIVMWAKEAGKTGKLDEMAKGFNELPEEEKQKYRARLVELREKFMADMDAFNKSQEGRTYNKNSMLVRKRFQIVAAKRKFLSEEPRKPPGAKRLFAIDTKNKPDQEGSVSERWGKLSEEERKKYDDIAKEKLAAYEEQMVEFKKSETFKKYEAVQKRLSKPQGNAKAKGKVKVAAKRKLSAKALAKKEKEESGMPARAPKPIALFMKDNQGGGNLAAQYTKWTGLGAEGQKPYIEKAAELQKKYEEDLAEWKKSDKGKRYMRGEESKKKKLKESMAKEKFLKAEGAPQEPAKPKNAMTLFYDEKKAEVKQEEPSLGERDLIKKLASLWSGLDAEGRKPYQTKATELAEKYNEDLEAYKNSDAYKKYAKAVGLARPQPKGKGKAKAKGGPAKAAADSSDSDSSDSDNAGGGRGRGRGGGGRGRGAAKAKAKAAAGSSSSSSSDSSDMGSGLDSD